MKRFSACAVFFNMVYLADLVVYDRKTTLADASACPVNTYNRTCCKENEFLCANGACIPMKKVCDYSVSEGSADDRLRRYLEKLDCTDGSDEVACFRKPCEKMKNQCGQSCLDLPGERSKCVCDRGFSLRQGFSDWTPECVDVDECAVGAHSCSQLCENNDGSYTCECREGFEKEPGGFDGYCRSKNRDIQIIYNSNSWIYSCNIENCVKRAVVLAGKVDDIDYNPVSDTIYWITNNHIARSRYVPGAKEGIAIVDYSTNMTKNGFSIDWMASNLYWISPDVDDDKSSRIMVSKLDGNYAKSLMQVSNAKDLVTDPESGLMFFVSSSVERYPYITAAWMDGTKSWILANLPNQNPTSLTVDFLSDGKLYWVDSSSNTIFYIRNGLNDEPKAVITTSSRQSPLSLDVFENHLYWVTKDSKEVVMQDKFGRGELKVLLKDLVNQSSLKVYHKSKLRTGKRKMRDRCGKNTCTHLCLHTPHKYSCASPDIFS